MLSRFVKLLKASAANNVGMETHTNPPERDRQYKLVRAAIFARRMRDDRFPANLFGEPAWDCLLDLYLALLEYRQLSASQLCAAATVPPTTALRWLDVLCQKNLAMRRPDPRDGRRTLVNLTPKGEVLMNSYFLGVSAHWNGC